MIARNSPRPAASVSLLCVASLLWVFAQATASPADNALELAKPGFHELRILSPTVVELMLVTTKASESSPVGEWNFVSDNGTAKIPAAGDFVVAAGGKAVS